jgi:Tfp pilus assembly protein PilE
MFIDNDEDNNGFFMIMMMITIMVSGILSVWKEYIWVNNLG